MTAIIIATLNALGILLPQIPGLIAEIRASPALSDGGKAVLDLIDARLVTDEAKVDAVPPLPVPPATVSG